VYQDRKIPFVCCFKRIVGAPVLPPIGFYRKSKRGGKLGYLREKPIMYIT
jgi:hypothetical protein